MINHFESSWMNEEVAMLEDTAKKFFKLGSIKTSSGEKTA